MTTKFDIHSKLIVLYSAYTDFETAVMNFQIENKLGFINEAFVELIMAKEAIQMRQFVGFCNGLKTSLLDNNVISESNLP